MAEPNETGQAARKQRAPQRCARFTARKRKKFLAALEELPNIKRAASAAGVSRATVYVAKANDPEFKAELEKALEIGIETAEDELYRRAVEGIEEPVFYEGARVDVVRKYSDLLLIFLLKGHKPEKYRDNYNLSISGTMTHHTEPTPTDLGRDLIFHAMLRMHRALRDSPDLALIPEETLKRRFLNEVLREYDLAPLPLDAPAAALPAPEPTAGPVAIEAAPLEAIEIADDDPQDEQPARQSGYRGSRDEQGL